MTEAVPRRGATMALDHALLALPVVITLWLLHAYAAQHRLAVDFGQTYWVAGLSVLHGGDPYAWTTRQIVGGAAFVYPAPAALAFAPFALLHKDVSDVLFTALCMLAVLGTLRLLRVRDWRVYAVCFLWWPVINAWQSANLTLLLCLALAAAWRLKDTPLRAGLVVAVAVSLKPFVWPIGLWLLATRRYRACGWAVAFALVLNGISWAVVGFGQLGAYEHLSSQVVTALDRTGYGITALVAHAGGSLATGAAVSVAASLACVLACVLAGRRGGDRSAFVLAVATMLIASPLVWNHYFALLIVPLAALRSRLCAAWVASLILWLCPSQGVSLWQAAVAWCVTCALVVSLVRGEVPSLMEAVARPRAGAADAA